jgi:hypothetical protein
MNKEGCDLGGDKLRVLNIEDINNLEEDGKMDEEGRRRNNKKLNNGKESDELNSKINSLNEKKMR